ncbi:MAG: peptide chain release factor N(5)-glutamine methyltransferase [Acidobacteria bacterium]|nr:peptide chain release factor N(5)-glutamine methyltransferase [Acidobacteriota bacterium]
MTESSLSQAVSQASQTLAAAGVPTPRVDAELLAAHLLGVNRGELRAKLLLDASSEPEGYAELVAERAQRVPLQHLTGVAYFRHLELAVGPGVFIPRPETESVAQLAIDVLMPLQRPLAVDLGTGSGALAGSLASEVPHSRVYAVELDPFAHAWAQRNLQPLGVTLECGDLRTAFEELDGTVDVVVANPPYIPANSIPREPEVADHDPAMALYGGGHDGMELPSAALASAARLLKAGGYFVMEHAEVQAPTIAALMRASGQWSNVSTHQDLNSKDRATSGVRK